jgi:hypothetical protein
LTAKSLQKSIVRILHFSYFFPRFAPFSVSPLIQPSPDSTHDWQQAEKCYFFSALRAVEVFSLNLSPPPLRQAVFFGGGEKYKMFFHGEHVFSSGS